MDLAVAVLAAAVTAGLLATALTALSLGYSRRRGLLDLPGRRRSHTRPTPRGGGIGIIAAVLLVGVPAWYALDPGVGPGQAAAMAFAVLAVALIGWCDDHAPLPVVPRIAVHAVAALAVAAVGLWPWAAVQTFLWWGLVPLALVLVGFINAHNFMDGIDGILGLQGVFVALGYGWLAASTGDAGIAALAFATAGGCLGFLLFNLPPARIFMGDVGSGTLGLTLGALGALVVRRDPAMFWACAILPSAFLVDSGLTLTRRVAGGQRWYTPHRQHLYQWLVRVKWSHGHTDVAYVIWNLAVVAPAAWLAVRWPAYGSWLCAVAWVLAAIAWYAGKRACLGAARNRAGCHHA